MARIYDLKAVLGDRKPKDDTSALRHIGEAALKVGVQKFAERAGLATKAELASVEQSAEDAKYYAVLFGLVLLAALLDQK